MSKKAMRCAAYVRVSREEQVEGFSLQAQERQIQNWVDRLSGEPVAMVTAVYRDEGLSGRTDDRPGFQQMIADARSGLLDAIVVHKFDRLARDRYDAVACPHVEASQSGVAAAAFGHRMPVVAMPIGGVAEQVIDGKTGVLARRVSSTALADAIKRLALEPGLYDALSRQLSENAGGRSMDRFVRDILQEIDN